MTGIYIHVPFCKRKCPYCDFYSVAVSDKSIMDKYCDAVIRNLSVYKGEKINSIYFGGGTPSMLEGYHAERIISSVRKFFNVSEDTEITLELNPSSTEETKLLAYKAAGVNRLSFGVQSANDGELEALGRLHNFKGAVKAVMSAYESGFDNISCDLMIGVPKQTEESLIRSIDELSRLPIKHISAYLLKVEYNTRYNCEEIKSQLPDDDKMCDMYLCAVERLKENGFYQYEISNFAKRGYESRHNTKYWELEPYIGIGPHAHSFFGNVRCCCPDSIDEFIVNPVQTSLVTDECPNELEEYIMLGLRLSKGISLDRINELGGNRNAAYAKAGLLCKTGLAVCDNDIIRLTENGFLVSNAVINEISDSATQPEIV